MCPELSVYSGGSLKQISRKTHDRHRFQSLCNPNRYLIRLPSKSNKSSTSLQNDQPISVPPRRLPLARYRSPGIHNASSLRCPKTTNTIPTNPSPALRLPPAVPILSAMPALYPRRRMETLPYGNPPGDRSYQRPEMHRHRRRTVYPLRRPHHQGRGHLGIVALSGHEEREEGTGGQHPDQEERERRGCGGVVE